jgi:cytochrome c
MKEPHGRRADDFNLLRTQEAAMNVPDNLPKIIAVAAIAGGIIIFGSRYFSQSQERGSVEVLVPKLSITAVSGKKVFDTNCAQCHGQNASGTNKGPPLVHDIYNPGHHGDQSFFQAIRKGVGQHHWPYGNMPPQPQVSENQMAVIVQYVRELQAANGIKYKPHHM